MASHQEFERGQLFVAPHPVVRPVADNYYLSQRLNIP